MMQQRLAGLGLALVMLATAITGAVAKGADAAEAGQLLIEQAWTRATPGGAKVGAGYMSIINHGDAADRLIAGESEIAERVEIHTMTMENGVMRMRQLKEGLVLAPKSITDLKPGGYHLMFIGLKKAIKQGDSIALQLTFEKAGTVDLTLAAAAIGAKSPPGEPAGAGEAAGSRSGGAGSGSDHNAAGSRSH
jgi:copper(I)-binding protein